VLQSDDDRTVRLVSYVPRQEKLEAGAKPQTLEAHVSAVSRAMESMLSRLALPDDIKRAAQLAADWHDHGKNREFFQRTVGGAPSAGQRPWPDRVMGKSGGQDRGKPARGYRHEFGSLREFSDAFHAGKLLDDAGKPISQEIFDLAAHLIAAHHGRARPHFPKGGFDPLDESRSDDIHTESIRRFAQLQRKYGWWHLAWLESLLRCADAMASADAGSGHETTEVEG
jgi:CRISPR-associated endonuclease/helicase Cas3